MTCPADIGDPFDAGTIAEFPLFSLLDSRPECYYDACTFVSGDALGAWLGGYAIRYPLIVHKRLVAATKARPVDLDEDLAGPGLFNWDLFDRCSAGFIMSLFDSGTLRRWN